MNPVEGLADGVAYTVVVFVCTVVVLKGAREEVLVDREVEVTNGDTVPAAVDVDSEAVVDLDQVLSGRSHTSVLAMLATRLELLPSALVDGTR